jgi:hypothetical protein
LLNLNQGPVWEKYGAEWGGGYQQMPVMKKNLKKFSIQRRREQCVRKGKEDGKYRKWKV